MLVLRLNKIKSSFHFNVNRQPNTFKEKLFLNIGNQLGYKISNHSSTAHQNLEISVQNKCVNRLIHRIFYKTDDNVNIKVKAKHRLLVEYVGIPLKEVKIDYIVKNKELKQIANGEPTIHQKNSLMNRLYQDMKNMAN